MDVYLLKQILVTHSIWAPCPSPACHAWLQEHATAAGESARAWQGEESVRKDCRREKKFLCNTWAIAQVRIAQG